MLSSRPSRRTNPARSVVEAGRRGGRTRPGVSARRSSSRRALVVDPGPRGGALVQNYRVVADTVYGELRMEGVVG